MSRNGIIVLLLMVFLFDVHGQDLKWHQLASVQVEGLDQISLDNRDNIFFSDEAGNVVMLGEKGDIANRYSPLFPSKLNQLEAFWTVNIFLFSAEIQQCVILDVFLNPLSTFSIPHENIGIVKAATLGNNNIFWLFDEVDLSLIQYDYQRNSILQDQPLPLILSSDRIEVLEMVERQNLLFMNIKNKGVYIFDNQGNFLKKLELRLDQKLNIINNSLYFLRDGIIHQINIFTGKQQRIKSPGISYENILVGADQVVFYSSSSVDIYEQPGFEIKR